MKSFVKYKWYMDFRLYRLLFFMLLIVQVIIALTVPLIHMMNDSGWYYMNVHYFSTGEYITESRYPSFHEPSQLYAFTGYSFLLFLSNKLALLTGLSTAFVVKLTQLCLHVISAFLIRNSIFRLTENRILAYVIAILFLLYYPYFNFVNLVMSETYATFFIILTLYLFIKYWQTEAWKTGFFLFLIAGYIILIKPVFIPVSFALMFFVLIRNWQKRTFVSALVLLSFIILPLAQAMFSKQHYGNYSLQSGFGWHMWDRVISYDRSIPENSENLTSLKEIFAKNGREIPLGYWWEVTKDLSEFGYSERQTQEICGEVAMDGLREHPLSYIGNTFINSCTNFLQVNQDIGVYPTKEEYFEIIEEFSIEPQHQPLTVELLKQSKHSTAIADLILKGNYAYAKGMNYVNYLYHNVLVMIAFILTGLHTIYLLFKGRFKEHVLEFVIWFIAFSIVFGSNLAEFPQSRLFQPAMIFCVMAIVLKIFTIANRAHKIE